jgi:hypothetical protein
MVSLYGNLKEYLENTKWLNPLKNHCLVF